MVLIYLAGFWKFAHTRFRAIKYGILKKIFKKKYFFKKNNDLKNWKKVRCKTFFSKARLQDRLFFIFSTHELECFLIFFLKKLYFSVISHFFKDFQNDDLGRSPFLKGFYW